MTATANVPAGSLSSEDPQHRASLRGRPVFVGLLILINTVAIYGQGAWAFEHVTTPTLPVETRIVIAVGIATAIELFGVFLAQMADQASEKRLPAAAGYRFGSFVIGGLAGVMNFWHWGPWGIAASITFALMSGSSPFAWGIYSAVRRGVKVAPSRMFWHPIRTVSVIRFAAWEGIADMDEAVMRWEMLRNAPEDAPISPAAGRSKEEIGLEAFRMRTENPNRSWERIAAELGVTPRHLLDCRNAAEAVTR